ncbi:MAG TPA: DMT family transporter [Xanthobacteraceae bacterium]|nr:DMT family transporter [Xanthobacteraceae bacterium]
MFSRRENLGLPLAFVGVVLFGGTLPATRLAVESLDPWFVTFARAAIAGTAALALLLVLCSRVPPRDTWGALALVALGSAIGFPLLTALAMQTVPAAHGGVVVGILPLATTIAGAWIAHERPSAGFWLTALAGTALVVSYALRHGGGGSFAAGDLFLLFGIATGAIGNAYSGRLVRVMPGWEVISWALVLVLPPSLVLALMLAPENRGAIPGSAWMALSYVAIVSQWVAFFPWNLGFKLAGIARVAQVQLLQTFVTLGLAALVNGEAIDLETIAFALAVVVTLMIGRTMRVSR